MSEATETTTCVLITAQMLQENFGACSSACKRFKIEYPDGLDIAGLWGALEERQALWMHLLSGWMGQHVGWAIRSGVLPARIEANLRGANLRRANLHRADLYKANLRGADLREADLYRANLRGANLYRADLGGADLDGADLYRANLRGAGLDGASLYGADLRGADLRGANLRGANLRRADLREAASDEYTHWPAGFNPEGRGTP